jgi:hypothetical protein
MSRPASARAIHTVAALALLSTAASVQANLLTDPSFEIGPLLPGIGVITNIPGNASTWGAENGNLVGVQGAVVPNSGIQMLEMLDDGAVATQGWQAVNVTGLAAQIDAGVVAYSVGAHYNHAGFVSAASASTALAFIDSSALWGNFSGPQVSSGMTLDSNPLSWQIIGSAGIIPNGTRWLVIQVAYGNASMAIPGAVNAPGYVDDAWIEVRVIPEPTSLSLLAAPALLGLRRRR